MQLYFFIIFQLKNLIQCSPLQILFRFSIIYVVAELVIGAYWVCFFSRWLVALAAFGLQLLFCVVAGWLCWAAGAACLLLSCSLFGFGLSQLWRFFFLHYKKIAFYDGKIPSQIPKTLSQKFFCDGSELLATVIGGLQQRGLLKAFSDGETPSRNIGDGKNAFQRRQNTVAI